MRIALVADVPDQAVDRRLVQPVQCDRELDHAEAGAEMPARDRDRVDQVPAQLLGDGREFGLGKAAQIARDGNLGQSRVALGIDHGRHQIKV